jgi:hypothetical protein
MVVVSQQDGPIISVDDGERRGEKAGTLDAFCDGTLDSEVGVGHGAERRGFAAGGGRGCAAAGREKGMMHVKIVGRFVD